VHIIASKTAFNVYSNTLRVELAPFSSKVVTILTGSVKSNIACVERSLPPRSAYIPINEEYQRRLKYSQEVGIPNEDYARSVLSKVLAKSPPRWVWEGNMSWVVWFALNFLPVSITVKLP